MKLPALGRSVKSLKLTTITWVIYMSSLAPTSRNPMISTNKWGDWKFWRRNWSASLKTSTIVLHALQLQKKPSTKHIWGSSENYPLKSAGKEYEISQLLQFFGKFPYMFLEKEAGYVGILAAKGPTFFMVKMLFIFLFGMAPNQGDYSVSEMDHLGYSLTSCPSWILQLERSVNLRK